jgi:hypothetical protein
MEMITPIKEYWEPDHPQIFMTKMLLPTSALFFSMNEDEQVHRNIFQMHAPHSPLAGFT